MSVFWNKICEKLCWLVFCPQCPLTVEQCPQMKKPVHLAAMLSGLPQILTLFTCRIICSLLLKTFQELRLELKASAQTQTYSLDSSLKESTEQVQAGYKEIGADACYLWYDLNHAWVSEFLLRWKLPVGWQRKFSLPLIRSALTRLLTDYWCQPDSISPTKTNQM